MHAKASGVHIMPLLKSPSIIVTSLAIGSGGKQRAVEQSVSQQRS